MGIQLLFKGIVWVSEYPLNALEEDKMLAQNHNGLLALDDL